MFLLNLQSKTPIYEQIQEQIMKFIEIGVLKPGDRLPSVRQMAMDNGINPNTVAKAYAEMEKNGYVYNLPKKGVYVAEVSVQTSQTVKIRAILEPLKKSGIRREELEAVINELYQEDVC